VSSAVGGSPYWPRTLNPPVNANDFEIVEDPAALAEFPPLELVYTFVEFDENDADVRRGVRVGGGEVVEINNVSLQRQDDGSSLLRVAGGVLRLNRTEQRRTARISVDTAPSTYDPAEEEVALRALAEALVQRARNQQATPPASPAPAQ